MAPPQQVLPEALPEDRLLRRALHPRRNLPPSGDVDVTMVFLPGCKIGPRLRELMPEGM